MDEMTNDENDDDVDAILATKPPVPDQIVFAVGDDIMPRYYTQSPGSAEPVGEVAPYELYPAATADWAEQVRNTSGLLIVCGTLVIIVMFSVGAVLTASAVRRVQTTVLSTAFYVLVAIVVDAFVLWTRCGSEWLRAAVGIDVRDILTSSNAVLCKVNCLCLSINLASSVNHHAS